MKAARVPALASSAMSFSDSRPDSTADRAPVSRVISTGVPVLALTRARAGSRPSRAITKKIRLWPYMKARITVGRATTAARATSWAILRLVQALQDEDQRGSLLENTSAREAPIATAATTM
jgi:hypothetical protein